MNKDRRKRLEKLENKLEDVRAAFQEIIDEIEEIKDEEQEAFDNLPESLQASEKGCAMEDCISSLEGAIDVDFDATIDEIVEYIDGVLYN